MLTVRFGRVAWDEKMEYWDPLDTNIQCRSSQQGEE